MIELQNDQLNFSFPEIHKDARFSINFQRTLRIPDDNNAYPLPPGFSQFPLFHVDDYKSRLPESWIKHGGIFLPMYQSEALWVCFTGSYPFAVKIATGKINAVSGDSWTECLNTNKQDYLVIPDQPWLDGYSVSDEHIRQFVAMPLGEGYTAEEQLTDSSDVGGIQIIAYPMKPEAYEEYFNNAKVLHGVVYNLSSPAIYEDSCAEMGIAPGGLMHQKIYEDKYGKEVWDTSASSRCFVHITNSQSFQHITGTKPPASPLSAQDYAKAGLPWFDYYDESLISLEGAETLAGLDSLAAKMIKKGKTPLKGNDPITNPKVKIISKIKKNVREGSF